MNIPQIKIFQRSIVEANSFRTFGESSLELQESVNVWLRENADNIQVHSVQTIINDIAITMVVAFELET